MESLIHCIYASRALATLTERDVLSLLHIARRNNATRGITGMLLLVERSFFQILEGPKPVVDETFLAISRDPRHSHITQIIREPIARRTFDGWTMGFQKSTASEIGELLGENDFFGNGSSLEALSSGRAKKMLMAFRNGGWRADATGVYESSGSR